MFRTCLMGLASIFLRVPLNMPNASQGHAGGVSTAIFYVFFPRKTICSYLPSYDMPPWMLPA